MAGVFAGTYAHSLDAKGRVIIPAGYRDKLGSGFTITINSTVDALVIYPAEKWASVYRKLVAVRDTDEVGTDYKRYLVANAQTDVDMDAQGRVLLPINVREAVGITREVTFVGMLEYVELWDKDAYAAKTASTRADFTTKRRHVDETYPGKENPGSQ